MFLTRVYQTEQIFVSGKPGQPVEAVNSLGDIDLAIEVQILKRPKWVLANSLTQGFLQGITSVEVMEVIKLEMENSIKP